MNLETTAKWHAEELLKTDSNIIEIYHCQNEKEIQFIVVSNLLEFFLEKELVPIDFGYGKDTDFPYKICFLDVSPENFKKIQEKELQLPNDWTLENAIQYVFKGK